MNKPSSFILIGPPFSGKTRSLGTLPDRTILFSWELEGYQSLRVPMQTCLSLRDFWKEGKPIEKVLVVDYASKPDSIGEKKEVLLSPSGMLSFIRDANSLPDHGKDYENLGIDSLSPFAKECLDLVIALNGRNSPQIQDYRDAIGKVKEILFKLQGLQKNFVLLAHFQAEKDEITGRSRQVPQVWGKDLPQDILKWFSTVLQSQALSNGKGGTDYSWKTKPEGLVESLGSRLVDDLPATIPQDFGALFGR